MLRVMIWDSGKENFWFNEVVFEVIVSDGDLIVWWSNDINDYSVITPVDERIKFTVEKA